MENIKYKVFGILYYYDIFTVCYNVVSMAIIGIYLTTLI